MLKGIGSLKLVMVLVVLLALAVAVACGPAATPTPTPAPTPTATATKAPPTPTPVPVATPTATVAGVATPTPTKAPVVSTPTPIVVPATATPTATVAAVKTAPETKSPKGTVVGAIVNVPAGPGLPRAQYPDEAHYMGVGEEFFRADSVDKWNEPQLAVGYTLAPDLSKVTLKLRQGVCFHWDDSWGKKYFTGACDEVTADDAAWTMNDINGAITPESIHGQSGDFAPYFLKVNVIDKYTIEIPFKIYDPRWQGNFLNSAGQAESITSKKAYDAMGVDWMRDHIIGTGPLQVVQWLRADKIILQKVPYQHWRQQAAYDQLRIVQVPEESTRVAMLQTGELDFAELAQKSIPALLPLGFQTVGHGNGIQPGIFFSGNLWETVLASDGKTPIVNPGAYAADLPWIGNPKDPADMEEAVNVRWALSLAIDRAAIVKAVLGGLGYPNYLQYIDSQKANNPFWDDKWKVPYDLAKAKEYLKKTAWPDGFQIPLYVQMPHPIRPEIADAVAGYWQALGSKMDIQVLKYDYTIFRPTVVGRTVTTPWLTECDEGKSIWPFDWPKAAVMSSLTRGGFGCGLEIPFMADTFKKVAAEADYNKRIEMNKTVAQYLYDQQLAVGVVGLPQLMVINPKGIKEWKMRPQLGWTAYQDMANIIPAK
ncbi:MAG: ABC transporter substrate-binding protein [Chloroflexota bacterium]